MHKCLTAAQGPSTPLIMCITVRYFPSPSVEALAVKVNNSFAVLIYLMALQWQNI